MQFQKAIHMLTSYSMCIYCIRAGRNQVLFLLALVWPEAGGQGKQTCSMLSCSAHFSSTQTPPILNSVFSFRPNKGS